MPPVLDESSLEWFNDNPNIFCVAGLLKTCFGVPEQTIVPFTSATRSEYLLCKSISWDSKLIVIS